MFENQKTCFDFETVHLFQIVQKRVFYELKHLVFFKK